MRGSIVAAIYALCALAEVAAAAKGTGGTQPKATSIRTNGRRSKTGGGSGGKAQQQDLQGRSTAPGRKRHKDAISYADGVSRVAKGEASSVGSSAAWDGGASEDEHVDVQASTMIYSNNSSQLPAASPHTQPSASLVLSREARTGSGDGAAVKTTSIDVCKLMLSACGVVSPVATGIVPTTSP